VEENTSSISGIISEETFSKLFKTLSSLRRDIIQIVSVIAGLSFLLYWISPNILSYLQEHLNQKLAFFGVMEPILGMLKIAVATSIIILAPWLLYKISSILVRNFGLSRKFAWFCVISASLLFYIGVGFCFFVTLPFGIKFLLGYQSQHLRPVISLDKFVNFVCLFLVCFGVIFELPLIMVVLSRMGICKPGFFSKYRRYAILIIAIVAAVLTPTPDAFNMSLMGVPLYMLYELGVFIAKIVAPSYNSEKDKETKE